MKQCILENRGEGLKQIMELSDYGATLFSYSGRGTVQYEGGVTRTVEFNAGQARDGHVRVLVHASDDPLGDVEAAMFEASEPLEFRGQSDAGDELTTVGRVWSDYFLPPSRAAGFYDALRVTQLRVDRNSEASIGQYRFGLANATLCGVERVNYVTDGVSGTSRGVSLRLPVGNDVLLDAILVPTPNSHQRAQAVVALRGIDVLHELIVQLSSPMDPNDIDQVATDICYVLSVARGSKVNWVYREARSFEGHLIERVHRTAITKQYSPCAPIKANGEFCRETVSLLTNGLAIYQARREQLRLDKGVIDAYLDAKVEADFLETRGAKISIAIEMLKSTFLKKPELGGREYVIERSAFEAILSALESSVNDVLEKAGVAPDDRKAISGVGKLRALNRRSFRSVLLKVLRFIDFRPPDREVALFLASRNKLVHEGCFYVDCATATERLELEPLADATTE